MKKARLRTENGLFQCHQPDSNPALDGEGFFRHIQQAVRASQHGFGVGLGTRQQTLEVEACRLNLGVVEHLFRGAISHFVQSHLGHTGPQVSEYRVTGVHQVVHRSGTDFFTVLHGGHTNLHGQVAPLLVDRCQRLDELFQLLVVGVLFAEYVNLLGEHFQSFALGHQNLTAQQIQSLDTGSTLVDHADTGVTYVLLHAPLSDEAVAAEDLHTQVGRLVTDFGQERLGDRSQEAQQRLSVLALFFGLATVNHVHLLASQVNQGAGAFSDNLLGQQHAAYVWVNNDRISDTVRVLRTAQGAHGQTILGVGQGTLEAKLSSTQTLDGGADTGSVHEGEHAVQAFVLRPDQPALGAVEVHHTGRVAVDTHLVLQGATGYRVTLAGRAIFVRQLLGNDKQGDTLGAFRCARQTCQYDVDDVLGHVVLAGRDKDLGASDAVGTVSVRLGLGTQGTQIRTTVRLGQTHGAGPLTADQLGQVGLLLLFGAVLFDGVGSTVAQARIHAPRPVGGTDHFTDHQANGVRQALTTVVGVGSHGRPATFNVLLVSFFEAGRGFHTVFAPGTAFLVTYLVQRRQYLLTELGAFLDDGINHIRSRVFSTFQIGVVLLAVQQLVHYEFNVTQGRFVFRHGIHLGLVSAECSNSLRPWVCSDTTMRCTAALIKHLFETYVLRHGIVNSPEQILCGPACRSCQPSSNGAIFRNSASRAGRRSVGVSSRPGRMPRQGAGMWLTR